MLCDGVYVGENAHVESCVLSPGVVIKPGAVVRESIIATDCVIEGGAVVERAILDKHVHVESNARVGWGIADQNIRIAMVGKHSIVPSGYVIEPEAQVSTDVIQSDYDDNVVHAGQLIQTRRLANEI
jgi:glucose-1-phosphate adenylyltransferase